MYKCRDIIVNPQARKKEREPKPTAVKLFKTRNEESVAELKFWKAVCLKMSRKIPGCKDSNFKVLPQV